jgi:hypothetical protein
MEMRYRSIALLGGLRMDVNPQTRSCFGSMGAAVCALDDGRRPYTVIINSKGR